MLRIKMLEKRSPYKVTYLADRPGEIGAKLYAKKVFAGNERDAVIAFNNWFDSCKAFPEGSSCDIQKVELIQGEGADASKKQETQRKYTFHLTTNGDMIGGFASGSVYKLANKSDVPLYLLSKTPNGSSEMVKVVSTKVADAKKASGGDPADWGDGYVLVVDGTINPWGVNWLTIDDNELVYIKIADLSKAVEFLTA